MCMGLSLGFLSCSTDLYENPATLRVFVSFLSEEVRWCKVRGINDIFMSLRRTVIKHSFHSQAQVFEKKFTFHQDVLTSWIL